MVDTATKLEAAISDGLRSVQPVEGRESTATTRRSPVPNADQLASFARALEAAVPVVYPGRRWTITFADEIDGAPPAGRDPLTPPARPGCSSGHDPLDRPS